MIKVTVLVSLYRCKNYIEHFLGHANLIDNKSEVEFLLLHNDPLQEEIDIIKNFKHQIPCFKHELIYQREGLYKTWNRGIKMARGEYITIWNVDDIRFPHSIAQQAQALDDNPDAAIAYGDMYGSNTYGTHAGKLYIHPDFNQHKTEFFQSYVMSCFQMWRKSLHDKIGYYDEQFKCVGDFDFQVRTAMYFPFVKVKQPLGIYLENLPHKLSSNSVQSLENNIVYLRYGIYKKIKLPLLPKANSLYKRHAFLFFDNWTSNHERSPFSLLYQAVGICRSFISIPMYYLKLLKSSL